MTHVKRHVILVFIAVGFPFRIEKWDTECKIHCPEISLYSAFVGLHCLKVGATGLLVKSNFNLFHN